jgi:hypothetical protein
VGGRERASAPGRPKILSPWLHQLGLREGRLSSTLDLVSASSPAGSGGLRLAFRLNENFARQLDDLL